MDNSAEGFFSDNSAEKASYDAIHGFLNERVGKPVRIFIQGDHIEGQLMELNSGYVKIRSYYSRMVTVTIVAIDGILAVSEIRRADTGGGDDGVRLTDIDDFLRESAYASVHFSGVALSGTVREVTDEYIRLDDSIIRNRNIVAASRHFETSNRGNII